MIKICMHCNVLFDNSRLSDRYTDGKIIIKIAVIKYNLQFTKIHSYLLIPWFTRKSDGSEIMLYSKMQENMWKYIVLQYIFMLYD